MDWPKIDFGLANWSRIDRVEKKSGISLSLSLSESSFVETLRSVPFLPLTKWGIVHWIDPVLARPVPLNGLLVPIMAMTWW